MTEANGIAAAEARAAAARQRLTATVGELQERLAPQALAKEAADTLSDAGRKALDTGVETARANPGGRDRRRSAARRRSSRASRHLRRLRAPQTRSSHRAAGPPAKGTRPMTNQQNQTTRSRRAQLDHARESAGQALETARDAAERAAQQTAATHREQSRRGDRRRPRARRARGGRAAASAREKELLAPVGRRIGATVTAAIAAAKDAGRQELGEVGPDPLLRAGPGPVAVRWRDQGRAPVRGSAAVECGQATRRRAAIIGFNPPRRSVKASAMSKLHLVFGGRVARPADARLRRPEDDRSRRHLPRLCQRRKGVARRGAAHRRRCRDEVRRGASATDCWSPT